MPVDCFGPLFIRKRRLGATLTRSVSKLCADFISLLYLGQVTKWSTPIGQLKSELMLELRFISSELQCIESLIVKYSLIKHLTL